MTAPDPRGGPGAGEQVLAHSGPAYGSYLRLLLTAGDEQAPATHPQPEGVTLQKATAVPHPRPQSLLLKGEAVARPVLKSLTLPSYSLDPRPTPSS